MEIAKTVYGAVLVFIGGILIAVGFQVWLANNWLTGVPMVLFGGYLTAAIYNDNILRHLGINWSLKNLRIGWRERAKT